MASQLMGKARTAGGATGVQVEADVSGAMSPGVPYVAHDLGEDDGYTALS